MPARTAGGRQARNPRYRCLGGRASIWTDSETGDTIDIGPHVKHSEYQNMILLSQRDNASALPYPSMANLAPATMVTFNGCEFRVMLALGVATFCSKIARVIRKPCR
jgi:hypothetical protein